MEVDNLLKRAGRHLNGGLLKIDAAVVDSGSGVHTDAVHGVGKQRVDRRVFAAKSQSMNRLQAGRTIRFRDTLDANRFE